MSLGKILGSISPAFGMLSGKGLFGHLPLNAMGGAGLGGILGMLLSHGSHGGGDEQSAPAPAAPQADVSSIYPGIDPMFTQGQPQGQFTGGMPDSMAGPHFGRFGGDVYLGGQNPVGQNAIGRFLGGAFR